MTLKQLKEKGLKVLFLKEGIEKCGKWDLLEHFKYLNKENINNPIYENGEDIKIYEQGVDMKIYFYDDNQCFVNIDCMKRTNGQNKYFTVQELVDYKHFFSHIFEVDEYME